MQAEIERKGLLAGKVHGTVSTADGELVKSPYVVVRKNEQTYTWAKGHEGQFAVQLPAGDYELYATAQGHSPGKPQEIKVQAEDEAEVSFSDLRSPGRVIFQVAEAGTGLPLDARITIQKGVQPVIGFMGQKIFFTELDSKGLCEAQLAPGDYTFSVQAGSPFLSLAQDVKVQVPSQQKVVHNVHVATLNKPRSRGWYGVDLHHHSDQLDGKTSPLLLVRSQLAAGLDYIFLSDHDTTVNHALVRELAAKRNAPFIPGIEISPSWGHFNAYPLQLGLSWDVDTSQADVHTMFAKARALGAQIIGVNHPFIKYGYFHNLEQNSTQGGWNPNFDLIELNGDVDYEQALHKAWSEWNKGWDTYLQAGTDAHDVMLEDEVSGSMRTMAWIQGAPTVDNLVQAVKSGHSYATTGPLVYPQGPIFGDTVKVKPGEAVQLSFELAAAQGLSHVDIIQAGQVENTISFEEAPQREEISLDVNVDSDSWVALVVYDQEENAAYTNPVWMDVREYTVATSEAE
jgi:hypothetical protein